MRKLDYMQRKALRRLGRGKSVQGRMLHDRVIRKCYDWPEIAPPKPLHEMNVVEWCDWEAEVRSTRPRLTQYGKKLLKGLDNGPRTD